MRNNNKHCSHKMGRRSFNRVCAINYPSRVEGWLDVCGECKKYFIILEIKCNLK